MAERLTAFYDVTAFTTCARDYVTWRNEMPAGEETLAGVRVRRFPVEEERDLASFNAFAEPLYGREHTDEEEQLFLRRQGPFAPRLVEALAAERGRFAAVVFFTYLYYPTYAGLLANDDGHVVLTLAPGLTSGFTFSTEDVVKQEVAPAGMLARRRRPGYADGLLEGALRQMWPDNETDRDFLNFTGVADTVAEIIVQAQGRPISIGIRYDLDQPFVLYAGRIDAGKGCAEMLAHYARYRRDVRGAARLVLIGKLAMPEPREDGVRYLGYLSEEEKAAALAGARAVICPSPYESLSIVLLEGMALGTPALATARSAVLLDHCRRSNAGLWYRDPDEFVEALDLLVREERLREALGANGRAYVRQGYRWDAVIERYRSLIEAVAGA